MDKHTKHNLTLLLVMLALNAIGLIVTGLATSIVSWQEATTYTILLALAGFIHWRIL